MTRNLPVGLHELLAAQVVQLGVAMSQTVVFLGPSLPLEAARSILAAEYRPPVQSGDVYRVLASEVRRIVGTTSWSCSSVRRR